MIPSLLTASALLAASVAAKTCINASVPVTVLSRNGIFNLDVPQTSLEATDFVANLTKQGQNFTDIALTGYHTINNTYQISTQFCTPSSGPGYADPTVQVLTHGIGFDKTYWDLSFNDFNYSYVDYALAQGYYTLSFDRLGIGNSSHGEPLNEIQAFIEVAATVQLTMMLRNGQFPGVSRAFGRVVHVGHSFGAGQTYSLANSYPDLTDGIILTGFSMNGSFLADFIAGANFMQARDNQPLRFSNVSAPTLEASLLQALTDFVAPFDLTSLPDLNAFGQMFSSSISQYLMPYLSALPPAQNLPYGYLISSNIEANKYNFLQPNNYDPMLLQVAEMTKQPVTLGELLSLGSLPLVNVFSGPVMVISGETDVPFCGGDCLATGGLAPSIPAMVQQSFPNVPSSDFMAMVHPNTGHGINLHYNATGAYEAIHSFLSTKGLASR